MKILALSVLFGFALFNSLNAFASPYELLCRANPNSFLSTSLIYDNQYGWISTALDGYETAIGPDSRHPFVNCKILGSTIECRGRWVFYLKPLHITFRKDDAGQISATFNRGMIGGYTDRVTLKCRHQAQQ